MRGGSGLHGEGMAIERPMAIGPIAADPFQSDLLAAAVVACPAHDASAPSPITSNTSNSSMLRRPLYRIVLFASAVRGSRSGVGRLQAIGAAIAADMLKLRLKHEWEQKVEIETRA